MYLEQYLKLERIHKYLASRIIIYTKLDFRYIRLRTFYELNLYGEIPVFFVFCNGWMFNNVIIFWTDKICVDIGFAYQYVFAKE
jgi:hypothetical protein